MSKINKSDDLAIKFATKKFKGLGWNAFDLNTIQTRYPNSDLKLTMGDREHYVQVKGKLQKKLNWVSVGYCSNAKLAARKLFNTAKGGTPCDFIMSVVLSGHHPNAEARYFLFPVEDAQAIFLKHALYHVAQPTQDGNPRSGNFELATFIGPGTHRVSNILDLHKEVLPYEDAFHLL